MLAGKKRVGVIIPAAGRGSRMGQKVPKQFRNLGGKSILLRTLERFQASRVVDCIVVVVARDDIQKVERMIVSRRLSKVCAVVQGGRVRHESVRNGLRELQQHAADVVLIHDAVRPFVSKELIGLVARVALREGACIPAVPVTDTIKVSNRKGIVRKTLSRESLWAAQTPQGFRNSLLCRAFEAAAKAGFTGTDEASIVERFGTSVRVVKGTRNNFKITTPDDITLANAVIRRGAVRG